MEPKESDYSKIDPALVPMFDFIRSFTDLGMEYANDPLALTITDIKLDIPLDLDIVSNQDGSLILGSAPPGMDAPISLHPVYHRIKITIVATDEQSIE